MNLPLTNAITQILLALCNGDLHGYGIMREIANRCDDGYKMGPGTLYDNLKLLLTAGLISESTGGGGKRDAKRVYHLTDAGAEALANELARLATVVRTGKSRLASLKERRV